MVVVFQSCAAGIVNTIGNTGESSGTAGFLLAIFMLSGGIVSAVTRKSVKSGPNIALLVLFGIAFLMGLTSVSGIFADLIVWTAWCGACLVMAIATLVICKTGNLKRGRIIAACGVPAAIILVVVGALSSGDKSGTASNIAHNTNTSPSPEVTAQTGEMETGSGSDQEIKADISSQEATAYEITDTHFEYNTNNIGSTVFYGYVEVLNTGNENLYLRDCVFDRIQT